MAGEAGFGGEREWLGLLPEVRQGRAVGSLGAARVGEGDRHEVGFFVAMGNRAEQVLQPAAEHAQPPVCGRRHLLHPGDPGGVQLDEPAALAVRGLGERVRQRRAAVAQVPGDRLLAVQVTERHVTEPVE